jgi:hypothetical protein
MAACGGGSLTRLKSELGGLACDEDCLGTQLVMLRIDLGHQGGHTGEDV